VLLGDRAEIDVEDVPVVLLGALLEFRYVLGVEQAGVVDDDPALSEIVEVLRERLDLLVAVVSLVLRVPGERVAERQQEVVPVTARLDVVVGGANLHVRVAPADSRRVVTMREHVEPRSHQGLREVLARRVDSVSGTARDSPDEFVVSHIWSPGP